MKAFGKRFHDICEEGGSRLREPSLFFIPTPVLYFFKQYDFIVLGVFKSFLLPSLPDLTKPEPSCRSEI